MRLASVCDMGVMVRCRCRLGVGMIQLMAKNLIAQIDINIYY